MAAHCPRRCLFQQRDTGFLEIHQEKASAAAKWEPPGVGSRGLWDLASTHLSLCGDCMGLSLTLGVSRTEDVWGHQVLLSGFRRFLSRAM